MSNIPEIGYEMLIAIVGVYPPGTSSLARPR